MNVAFVLLSFAILVAPDETVFSGPQPGEAVHPFDVVSVFGDDSGSAMTVASGSGKRPQALIFLHEKSRPAFGLSLAILKLAKDRRGKLDHAFVYLTDEPTEGVRWLENIQRLFPGDVRAGVYQKGVEGPEAYGLNRNVAMTVVIAKGNRVTANFALVQPGIEADGPRIFKAISDVLGEKTAANIEDYVGAQMRAKTGAPSMRKAAERDPKLRSLLVPLLNRKATVEQVNAAAKSIEEYADANPRTRTQIGDIARRIMKADKLSNYGTKPCQEFLKKWAAEFKAGKADQAGDGDSTSKNRAES